MSSSVFFSFSGFLQVQQRNYYRSWHPQRPESTALNFLHLNHFSSKAVLKKDNPFSEIAGCGHFLQVRDYSTNPDPKSSNKSGGATSGSENKQPPAAQAEEKNLSIFQRFKLAYKKHGKVLVGVHVATSIVWYGSFYTAARW